MEKVENKKLAEIFSGAITYLEKGWCKGNYAQDQCGVDIDARHPDACYWCAIGSIYIADESANFTRAILLLGEKVGCISRWNDYATQEIVIKQFREIVAELQQTEP